MQKQGKCKTELQTSAPFYITISMSELSYKDEVYLIFKKSVSLMRSLEKTIEWLQSDPNKVTKQWKFDE